MGESGFLSTMAYDANNSDFIWGGCINRSGGMLVCFPLAWHAYFKIGQAKPSCLPAMLNLVSNPDLP